MSDGLFVGYQRIPSPVVPALRMLGDAHAIGQFTDESGSPTLLWQDVIDVERLTVGSGPNVFGDQLALPLEPIDSDHSFLRLSSGGAIVRNSDKEIVAPPELGPIIRSVVGFDRTITSPALSADGLYTRLPGRWELVGGSEELHQFARLRMKMIERFRIGQADFANSAYYMGSKRALLPFLMAACDDWIGSKTSVIDLMCGSGAVSGALATRWTTYASDAERFCRCLAVVQAGGYSLNRAGEAMAALRAQFDRNQAWLFERCGQAIEEEDQIFHTSGSDDNFTLRYGQFLRTFPTYPGGGVYGSWDPLAEVSLRQTGARWSRPACLFTAYFANVYFGLRQCVDIDSLRCAIESLPEELDRTWCTGALIAACSSVGSGYGGHFAQPSITAERLRNPRSLRHVMNKRTLSVFREFEARLFALASNSEAIENSTIVLEGPWRNALDQFAARVHGNGAVYLDAPYRREEYSRYYHLLNTLVEYSYPSATGKARIPRKGAAERFSSEFFTRVHDRKVGALASVVNEIVGYGFQCLWSYSSTADLSVLEVLTQLRRGIGVSSVSASHTYSRQGGHSSAKEEVDEYLVLIRP